MRWLGDFWSGRLPLGQAFWTCAVLIGAAVNIAATGASLAALTAELPGVVALAIHLLPLPYNVAMVVGVWRSAARHPGFGGSQYQAQMARFAVIAWATLLTLV